MRGRVMLRGTVLALASLLVAAPGVGAAPTWIGPNDLSAPGGDASTARIVVGVGGEATAVWVRSNGTHVVLQYATRASGAPAFTTPVDLSSPASDASQPALAVDAQGVVTAVWRQDGAPGMIEAASRSPGGAFSAPAFVSSPATDASSPQVAADGSGRVTVVWTAIPAAATYVVEVASRAPGAGAFSTPTALSATGTADPLPRLAADPAGDVIAAWDQADSHLEAAHSTIQAARRTAVASFFTTAMDVSTPGSESDAAQVAVDAQGGATIVWDRLGPPTTVVQASTWPLAAPAPSPPGAVSSAATSADTPLVVANGAGDVTAVWRQADDAGTSIVGAARRPVGALGFGTPMALSAPGGVVDSLGLAGSPAGSVAALWSRTVGGKHAIEGALLAPGAAAFVPTAVSVGPQPAVDPALAFDDEGNALAVWSRSDGANAIAQTTLLDAAGPVLSGLTVPAGPIGTGSSGTYSVTATDRWSAVTSVVWDFGDGTTAIGASVAHVYGTPGTKTVTVTATDAVGNATTAVATVTVVFVDRTKPKLTTAFLYVPRLRSFGRGAPFAPATSANRTVGTTLELTSSEAGRVEIATQRVQIGRSKKGGRCLAARSVGPPCVILRTLPGRTRRRIARGSTTLRFTGRLASRRLAPGSYRLVLTVTDPTGNTSDAARIVFRIVR